MSTVAIMYCSGNKDGKLESMHMVSIDLFLFLIFPTNGWLSLRTWKPCNGRLTCIFLKEKLHIHRPIPQSEHKTCHLSH